MLYDQRHFLRSRADKRSYVIPASALASTFAELETTRSLRGCTALARGVLSVDGRDGRPRDIHPPGAAAATARCVIGPVMESALLRSISKRLAV